MYLQVLALVSYRTRAFSLMRLLPSELARVVTKVIALESGIEAENEAEIEIKEAIKKR